MTMDHSEAPERQGLSEINLLGRKSGDEALGWGLGERGGCQKWQEMARI
jgi:hypothetical protein